MTNKQKDHMNRCLDRLMEYSGKLKNRFFMCVLERKDTGKLMEIYIQKLIKILNEIQEEDE